MIFCYLRTWKNNRKKTKKSSKLCYYDDIRLKIIFNIQCSVSQEKMIFPHSTSYGMWATCEPVFASDESLVLIILFLQDLRHRHASFYVFHFCAVSSRSFVNNHVIKIFHFLWWQIVTILQSSKYCYQTIQSTEIPFYHCFTMGWPFTSHYLLRVIARG